MVWQGLANPSRVEFAGLRYLGSFDPRLFMGNHAVVRCVNWPVGRRRHGANPSGVNRPQVRSDLGHDRGPAAGLAVSAKGGRALDEGGMW